MISTSRLFSLALLALVIVIASPLSATATDYYVSTSGNNGSPGTLAQPWKTIEYADAHIGPGDAVYIRGGTYLEMIGNFLTQSGNAGNPITYRPYLNETVQLGSYSSSVIDRGVSLTGRSYIIVQGPFQFENIRTPVRLHGSDHCEISYCTSGKPPLTDQAWSMVKIYYSSSYNWLYHCEFSGNGTTDNSSIIDIGNEYSTTDISNHNLVENNTFDHAGHHVIGIYGKYNVVRNNHFHNETFVNNNGVTVIPRRVVYLNGKEVNSGRNLVEDNIVAYAAYGPGISCDSRHNIIRRNVSYNHGLFGINHYFADTYITNGVSDGPPQYNVTYNNTVYHNGLNTSQPAGYRQGIGYTYDYTDHANEYIGNEAKNNILYANAYSDFSFYGINSGLIVLANNWIDTQADPLFVRASSSLGDPTNSNEYDFHLQATSPCIDAGGALTTVTSASGSGTSFQVANANYFMNGWGIVQGDTMQLLGTTQRATITGVDYSGNMITVDKNLTWTQKQGLSLAYVGKAPDVGAYESAATSPSPSPPKNLRIIR